MKLRVAAMLALLLAVPALGFCQKPVVLVDESHGQRFSFVKEGDLHLSGLGRIFTEAGFDLKILEGKVTPEKLSGAASFVSSGLFVTYDENERKALDEFMQNGGGVAFMSHVAPLFGPILKDMGLAAFVAPIIETKNVVGGQGTDFTVTDLADHPLNVGLKGFNVYGGWALFAAKESALVPVARTSGGAWLDLNKDGYYQEVEQMRVFNMVVAGTMGRGRYVVFGDDALFQNKFLIGDNQKLARNLALWLMPAARL